MHLSDVCFANILSVGGLPIHLFNSVFSKPELFIFKFKLSFTAFWPLSKNAFFIHYFVLLVISGKKVKPPYGIPSWSEIVLNHKLAEDRIGLLLSSPLPSVVYLVYGKYPK